jgi:hypothetical protein
MNMYIYIYKYMGIEVMVSSNSCDDDVYLIQVTTYGLQYLSPYLYRGSQNGTSLAFRDLLVELPDPGNVGIWRIKKKKKKKRYIDRRIHIYTYISSIQIWASH